jgi:tetratricopeptide (TPR) repeat protein
VTSADSTADSPSGQAPQAGFTRRLAQSHFERAEALELRGDIAQALQEYTASIGIDSTLGAAYLRLGALRERMGDPREADLVYSEAARLTDTRSQALLERSHLRRAVGLNAQAVSDLEAAVDLDDSRALLEELARDYVELHAWSAALAVFRRIAASAAETGDAAALETARLEVRALRVLAAETDPSQDVPKKHDWVSRALRSIARR